MLEVDVRVTRDGELFLVHDPELELDGRRLSVEESDAHALRDACGEVPPATLRDLLETVPEALPINLELKRDRADDALLIERLLATVCDRPRLLVSSFDWDLLARLRRERPNLPRAPIGSRRAHELLRAAEELDATTIHCHRRLAFDDFLSATRAGGWPVLVYTINDPTLASSIFDRGASGIFTDRPGGMLLDLGLR